MEEDHSVVPYRSDVLLHVQTSLCNEQANDRYGGADKCLMKFNALVACLSKPPSFTTLRFNKRLSLDSTFVVERLKDALVEPYKRMQRRCPEILPHPLIPDCLLIRNEGPVQRKCVDKEVIIDTACGMAVLRGSDIFVQGILAAHAGMFKGDLVSVYIDVDRRCTKGLAKAFTGSKIFVGNGVSEVGRDEVFCSKETLRGLGITMTEPVYIAPSLSDVLPDLVFAQNLPSIVCVHALDPQPGELVLDLCAAPGGKTVHIATLMNNIGRVVAIDKCRSKIGTVQRNAARWNIDCVEVYCFDGTLAISDIAVPGEKLCVNCMRRATELARNLQTYESQDLQLDIEIGLDTAPQEMTGGPPYPPGVFDRVLLDAPCSGLGQRPVIRSSMTLTEVQSYPALQKKLFKQAVGLLKDGGCLVYSTCTITLEENECIVAWALKSFPQLTLVKQTPCLGGPAWPRSGLNSEQERLVQRFDPSSLNNEFESVVADCSHRYNTDTIGFFIAKFLKTNIVS